jgi:hypothetical protein
MKTAGYSILLLPLLLWSADCQKLEADFAALDRDYRMARTIQSPTKRYDYYYRYIVAGAELMTQCRTDRRNYRYTEIVRKLRAAERERAGVRQAVIEEQWKLNDVKPVIKRVFQNCSYSR